MCLGEIQIIGGQRQCGIYLRLGVFTKENMNEVGKVFLFSVLSYFLDINLSLYKFIAD